jgi:predicted esterase
MCGQLKGLVGLSCFIPRVGELAATGATWSHTPVLLCHGEADNVIPRTEAERTQRVLQELGATEVQLLEYSFLQHGINLLELKDTALFIAQTRGVVQPPPRGGWF